MNIEIQLNTTASVIPSKLVIYPKKHLEFEVRVKADNMGINVAKTVVIRDEQFNQIVSALASLLADTPAGQQIIGTALNEISALVGDLPIETLDATALYDLFKTEIQIPVVEELQAETIVNS